MSLPSQIKSRDETACTYSVDAVLLDIEGTISPLSYVRDVLFPFTGSRLRDFVRRREREPEVAALLEETRRVSGSEDALSVLESWHRDDVKAPPLKALQGMIWAEGYAQGIFVGPVYPDALEAFHRWRSVGVRLFVYSSGSLQAQDLFFRYSGAELTAAETAGLQVAHVVKDGTRLDPRWNSAGNFSQIRISSDGRKFGRAGVDAPPAGAD